MPPADPIASSLELLFKRTTHGIRPGVGRVTALLDRLDRPHRAFPCLHVAGTNGKGSVCAMLESVLRAAGLRTGLYTSPHLVRFHERIRVGGRPIGDADLARLLGTVEREAAALDAGPDGEATFFELTTALAFLHFREAGVQMAVIETGMGGRWDATNVVIPVVSVITAIDVDHAEYLGRSVADIAAEKAGIIKPGRPVVCGADHPEAAAVVRGQAAEARAPFVDAGTDVSVRRLAQSLDGQRIRIDTASRSLPPVTLPLLGPHQIRNVALAMTTLEQLGAITGVPVPDEAVTSGLAGTFWPARLQILRRDPLVLLDGAHNPHGAHALAEALHELGGRRPVGLVAGLLADKDADGFFAALQPKIRRVWAVTAPGGRGRPAAEIALAARRHRLPAEPSDLATAWTSAADWARTGNGLICIAGSLYLAGEVLLRWGGGDHLFL